MDCQKSAMEFYSKVGTHEDLVFAQRVAEWSRPNEIRISSSPNHHFTFTVGREHEVG